MTATNMERPPQTDRTPETAANESPEREVRFEHSSDLADLLGKLNVTLLVSTYQAGKLAVIGTQQRNLTLSFHNFDRPMGVAVDPHGEKLAVAAR